MPKYRLADEWFCMRRLQANKTFGDVPCSWDGNSFAHRRRAFAGIQKRAIRKSNDFAQQRNPQHRLSNKNHSNDYRKTHLYQNRDNRRNTFFGKIMPLESGCFTKPIMPTDRSLSCRSPSSRSFAKQSRGVLPRSCAKAMTATRISSRVRRAVAPACGRNGWAGIWGKRWDYPSRPLLSPRCRLP